MPAPYKQHARRHLPGGSDPIPGLLPAQTAGDFPAAVLALPDLRGYWRLGEGAPLYADTSGYNPSNPADLSVNAGSVGSTPISEDVTPGLLPPTWDDGAVAFNHEQNEPAPLRPCLEDADGSSRVNFDFGSSHPTMSFVARIKPAAATATFWGAVVGDTLQPHGYGGWGLWVRFPAGTVEFFRAAGAGSMVAATAPPLTAGEEYTIVGTYDGALIRLYVNGVLAASATDTQTVPHTSSSAVRLGGVYWDDIWRPFLGVVDEVAIWGAVLTDSDAANLHAQATGETSADGEGWVVTSDGHGGSSWQPPGVEVTHGDNPPVEAPVTSPPSLSGPTTGSGWHTNVHVETAVLYDSSPARFDVPSRTWTRVPFNTVRIQRQWETTVNGPVKSAWLADDRGLTSQARNGLLHVTADMQSPQDVSGWYSIEYPVLDFTGLPDYSSEAGVDAYARAARIVDATGGTVLRETPGSSDRQFFEWLFRDFAADGLVGIEQYAADNPYPVYASWGGRPLLKPAPYPQIDAASSLVYYKRDAFYGGFSHEYPVAVVDATLSAGANLCLQAWQDTPWQLRFSTDHFPNYTPLPYPEAWKQRPYLAVSYSYDPDSIDHTTGALL